MNNSDSIVKKNAEDISTLAAGLVQMRELAGAYIKAGCFPNHPNEYSALASIEAGRELGVPPIMALGTIYPIKGRLVIESKTMLALFHQRGGSSQWVKRTAEVAELKLALPGREPETFTYTIQEAQRAGLTKKDNWMNYPGDMLVARCISRGIKGYDPGATLGMLSREEAEDGEGAVMVVDMPKVETEKYVPPVKSSGVIEGEVVKEPKPAPKGKVKKVEEAPLEPVKPEEKVAPVAPEAVKEEAPAHPAPVAQTQAEVEPPMSDEAKSVALGMIEKLEALGRTDIREAVAKRMTKKTGKQFGKDTLLDNLTAKEGEIVIYLLDLTIQKDTPK
jgi:hypothetical protein